MPTAHFGIDFGSFYILVPKQFLNKKPCLFHVLTNVWRNCAAIREYQPIDKNKYLRKIFHF